MARLTVRRLNAIEGALSAMLAGQEGEGDWPDGVTMKDMEAAWEWTAQELSKRTPRNTWSRQ